ncbi:MAG: 50S ribosomal protein L17 [Omnitrophica bacterium RIFCSPLOWO2_01_FULL_45_10]|nr:MAG: 50S ribosomal protein L17 [Omnitrophica bacterium RIFCSPLOWO2_01_FULL_45_10]
MRHRKRLRKLSMKTSHRKAMLRNTVRNLLRHQRITLTLARAKETRRLAERVLSMAKTDSVYSRRRIYSILPDRDMIAKLFKEIAPLFKERKSGYTRIIPLNFRRGDGASMAILELTEKKIVEKFPKKKKKETAKTPARKGLETGREERPEGEQPKPLKEGKKKEEPRAKIIPRTKPTLEEEKRSEKAKSEDKRMQDKKGFLKNLRGFFRRKTDM